MPPLVKSLADFLILKALLSILPREHYFPLKKTKGFDKKFYSDSLSEINSFVKTFGQWYGELSSTKRAFAPVTGIEPSDMANIIKKSITLNAKNDSYYLLEMIKYSRQEKGTSNKIRDFLDCAYNAIDKYTNKITK